MRRLEEDWVKLLSGNRGSSQIPPEGATPKEVQP